MSYNTLLFSKENDFVDDNRSENKDIDHPKSPSFSKIASSASISSIASLPIHDPLPNLSVLDVKKRLSDLIHSRGNDLIQACKNFDRRTTKKIPKAQFRQVLRTFCFPITAAQFDGLCKDLQVTEGGKLNYIEFFSKLSNGKDLVVQGKPALISNDLPIDEVELRIKEMMSQKLYDIIRAFWLFDINKDGFIQKTELRRIIRNYCFDISDEMFNNLWKTYDPKGTGVIRYEDFLVKIGINSDRYKKYMPSETVALAMSWSDKKAKTTLEDRSLEQRSRRAALENRDDPAIQGLPLEEIMEVFMNRLHRRSQVLKNTFKLFDYEKNGLITVSDFHGIINFFVLAMSPSLFSRISKRLDICSSLDCRIDYEDFLNKYCKHVTAKKNSVASNSKKLECHPIVQTLKNHIINPCSRLQSVFTKINPDKNWQITRQELKKAIELGLDFRMSEDEFTDLLALLDPGNTNMVNCMDFLHLFESNSKDSGDGISAHEDIKSEDDENFALEEDINIKYLNLTGGKLKSKLKHYLNKNRMDINRALLVCDPRQSGLIKRKRFHDILETYCFPLSDSQFAELMSAVQKYGECLNYTEFMDLFKKMPNDEADKWVSTVKKLVAYKSRCPPALPVDEAEELLRECIHARKSALLEDFMLLDPCDVGVVCKNDVKSVLNKFSFRFNEQQFEELWKKFPCNKFNQLIYEQFLEEFSILPNDNVAAKEVSPPKVATREPCKMHKEKPIQPQGSRKCAKEMLFSIAPHLKPLFEAIEPTIVRNFRAIRFHLQRTDKKSGGIVDFGALKIILNKNGIFLSNEEEFHLLEYFDPYLSGKINYRDFLRYFVWYA